MSIDLTPGAFKPDFNSCDRQERADVLAQLVASIIADGGYHFDGRVWAANSQEWWCEQLGISTATLRRLIGKPPFIREWALVNGRRMTLLRLGEKGPPTSRDIARGLRNIWRKRTNEIETGKQFGCLVGLALLWGEAAPQIFSAVLREWAFFMTGVKLQDEWTVNRHYKYPSITLIRRFPEVAEEVYLTLVQEGKA